MYNNYGAMSVSAAYRCTELISDGIATLPVMVKKKTAKGSSLIKNHYINLLFSDKDNILTKFTFLKMLTQSVILRGNGFAYIHRAADGTPVKLQFLEAGDVTIYYDKNKNELYYQSALIKGTNRINRKDMLHFVKTHIMALQVYQ